MSDLTPAARWFEASSRLGRAAAAWRGRLATDPDPAVEQRADADLDLDALGWAATLLAHLDFELTDAGPRPAGGAGWCIQAAEVRPTYYLVLQGLASDLIEVGVTHRSLLREFLIDAVQWLEAGVVPEAPAERRRAVLLAQLLQGLADRLAGRLHRNGVPAPHPPAEMPAGG